MQISLNKDPCRSWLQLDSLKAVVYGFNRLKKYRTNFITPYPNFWHSKISDNSWISYLIWIWNISNINKIHQEMVKYVLKHSFMINLNCFLVNLVNFYQKCENTTCFKRWFLGKLQFFCESSPVCNDSFMITLVE